MSNHTLLGGIMFKINNIDTREELAILLDIPLRKLTYILYAQKVESYYVSFDIPKKSGGLRSINAPTGDLKDLQQKLSKILTDYYQEIINDENILAKVSNGFLKGKGIITNAYIHRNKRYILNLDIEDFFPSFHFGRVRGYFEKNKYFNLNNKIATILAQLTCFNGALPQGAPTSPIITNLICNILDIRILKICKKYKVDYTRYADDLSFSTNRKDFLSIKDGFIEEIEKEINDFGLKINNQKTRLLYSDSRQEVTGLIVNDKLGIKKEFYKNTRAMANELYNTGSFTIDGVEGTLKQLEGRFSFIDQLDKYNNRFCKKGKNFRNLSSREAEYQQFLFYKYFFTNELPLIVTEGKTDILYIKAALKNLVKEYPDLLSEDGEGFKFTFLNKSDRLEFFLGLTIDGGNALKNIYNIYTGKNNLPNLIKRLSVNDTKPKNPVILLLDNEQKSKSNRPLKDFLSYISCEKPPTNDCLSYHITQNLYLLTNSLVKGKEECEIEDLFEDNLLSMTIDGKTFSRESKFDNKKHFGKAVFADHVSKNYRDIDFTKFKPMLNEMVKIIKNY